MRVGKLTDITLISSNVSASTYSEYSASTTYAKGANVKVSFESDGTTPRWPVGEYESNVATNLGHYPPDDTTNWYPIGTENRGAMFDEYVNTQTSNEETIEVIIDASRCSLIGLFLLQARSVAFTHIVNIELITDGDCTSDSFTGESGWSYDAVNDEYDCSGAQTEATKLYQPVTTAENKQYQIVFTVSNYSAGTIAGLAGGTQGESVNNNGTHTIVILAGATQQIGVIADSDFIGSVTDISVKKISKQETISLATASVAGWYSHFFSQREYKSDILWSFPWYSNALLKIVITWVSGEQAKCGMVAIGEQRALGILRETPTLGIIDYSIKETDSFGRTTLSKGAGAKVSDYDFWASAREADRIYRLLADLRGERVIFDGNNDGSAIVYECFITYGFYRDFKVLVPGGLRSKYNINIEGLI